MRTIYLFFSFFILSIFSVFGSIVDVEKTHIRITSPDSLIHFHFYQRMDSDEQYHLYYSISYKDKVIIKESRMGLELDNKVWEMALAEDIQRKDCSVLNKLTLQKSKIKMKYSKKQYNYYSDDERMSYIREYLSSPESKSEFCKRHGFCAKLLTYWLNKYQIEDKDMGRSSKPVNSDAIDSSISELQKELSLLRAENRKLHRALADESLRHEACEELINLAESTYHIKVRKNSDAK